MRSALCGGGSWELEASERAEDSKSDVGRGDLHWKTWIAGTYSKGNGAGEYLKYTSLESKISLQYVLNFY